MVKNVKMKFNLTHQQLKDSEKRIYSQGMQDGILEAIFKHLKINEGYLIDVGAKDGLEISNSANLRMNFGWSCLLIDAEPLSDFVKKETITKENINGILKKYHVPKEVDLLTLDIDGIDIYVWKAIRINPKVVSIEFNSKFRNDESYTIEYNKKQKWEGDDYYGASLLALKKLGEQKGYTLVYAVDRYDAIFVRNDLLSSDYKPSTIDEIFPEPIVAHQIISNKKWIEIK